MKKLSHSFKYILTGLLATSLLLSMPGCGKTESNPELNTSAASLVPTTLEPSEGSSEGASEGESSASAKDPGVTRGVYLGLKGYGNVTLNKNNASGFKYRFKVNGKEVEYLMDTAGQNFTIQNNLKVGYLYDLTISNNTITAATLKDSGEYADFKPAVSGNPGEKTILNFLKTAASPAGTTLYVYGGGWNWQDTGSGVASRTLGVSPDWVRFFNQQTENYDFNKYALAEESYTPTGGINQYHYAGLDCSGYIGWALYNTFETSSLKNGYVTKASSFAKTMGDKGVGTFSKNKIATGAANLYKTLPGDIVSIQAHCWISLGTGSDGSTLLLDCDCTPSRGDKPGGGVQLGVIGTSRNCEAYTLAKRYTAKYYPDWYARYNVYLRNPIIYFDFSGSNPGIFSWDTNNKAGLTDPDGIRNLSPAEVLTRIYGS